jgi:DNA-binding CsgD family transcriptional regulator
MVVQVQCRPALLHQGAVQLVAQAGFVVVAERDAPAVIRVTDDPGLLGDLPVIWVHHGAGAIPPGIAAVMDLETTAEELHALIHQALQDPLGRYQESVPLLSERERQVMTLLADGQRDRAIAQALYISESTVKFHINNSLAKLKAKNRYQGVYQAVVQGWI